MLRPPIAIGALVFAAAVLPSASAQDAAAQVDKRVYWSAEPRPAKPVPPPIVPEHWIVVPKDTNVSVAQVFTRHLLDPTCPVPAVDGAGLPWKAVDSKNPAGVVAAFTRITSERDDVRMARLTGAEYLFVNGDGFVGDVHGRGFRGVPIALNKGDNELLVLGVPESFELELWVPQTRTVLGSWDVAWLGENQLANDISYPIFNASTEPAAFVHVHYGHAVIEGGSCKPIIGEWRDGGRMLPLGLRIGGSYFSSLGRPCDPLSAEQAALVPISVYSDGDSLPDMAVLRCAPASEGKASLARHLPPRQVAALADTPFASLAARTVLVLPDASSPARARLDQELCWYLAWFVPEAISGEELVKVAPSQDGTPGDGKVHWPWRFQNFVLYGNADTNPAWSQFVATDFPIEAREGRLVVNGTEYMGDDICGSFKVRAKSGKRAVLVVDTGPKGSRLGYLVQPLLSDADRLDYCFWDSRGEGGVPRVIASGRLAEEK